MTTPDRSNGDDTGPVSFAQKVTRSRFKELYREGMALVEEVAAYLDGPGRQEAKTLPRQMAIAYAAESMRLTTRLMQIASWLLVQKSIVEGDLDKAQGLLETNRVKLTQQSIASQAAVFAHLPDVLQELTARSLQIQNRILMLQAQDKPAQPRPVAVSGLGIMSQFDLLRRAFQPGPQAT